MAKQNDLTIQPNKKVKLILRSFWEQVSLDGPEIAAKSFISRLPTADTLSVLKDFSNIEVKYKKTAPLAEHRQAFDHLKHLRFKNVHKRICFACRKPAELRHHIMPLKNGGRNAKRNVVYLCRRCHAEIHPWLKCLTA